jgi:hypothetical protein
MERLRAKRKLEQKRQQELFRQGGFEDFQPRPSRSHHREEQDEYEDDFGKNFLFYYLVDDLEEFMHEDESGSEDEQKSAALLEAKRPFIQADVKSKRLRIIEDSDSD